MTILSANDRAYSVLSHNQYFALATTDDDGPWVAILAYVMGPPKCLYFFSQKSSRHGSAIIDPAPISGAIYDSTCAPEDAESIQFSGKGEVAQNRADIEFVLKAAAVRDNQSPPSEEEIKEKVNSKSTLLYKVTIDKAYVLDQKLFEREGIDGRQEFSIENVFGKLTA